MKEQCSVDLCILSGKLHIVRAALRYAKEAANAGKRILIAVKETYLGTDICSAFRYRLTAGERAFFPEEALAGEFLRPDAGKRYLEERCLEAGIELLYGVYPLGWEYRSGDDGEETADQILLHAAAKGGEFTIRCGRLWREDTDAAGDKAVDAGAVDGGTEERGRHGRREYTALIGGFTGPDRNGAVTEGTDGGGAAVSYRLEGNEGIGLLTVELPGHGKSALKSGKSGGQEPVNTAAALLEAWRRILPAFRQLREELPGLRLGRFAERIAAEEAAAAGTGKRSPASAVDRAGCVGPREEREEWFDLAVAGGGTAGAMAALYAARGGLKTVLIEPLYTLGGTSTAGGVSTYWFGNRFSDVREIDEATEKMAAPLKLSRREGIWSKTDDFHPGIRGAALTELCLEAGVDIRFGQIVYDTVHGEPERCADGTRETAQRRCRGVRTTGDWGRITFYAKAVIDATGDGDLAVSAGADTVYGSERDCITYWASLAQYTDVDKYRNNFSSMLVASDPADATRFILLGRRRGEATFDHGSYVSMRESRHIRGKTTITLKDLMTFRTYEDALYTCYSNYDPKGKLDADAVYCGVLPPQAKIQIPLSALLPCDREGRRIEGLYVAGKAIGATHNVFPSIRMQPDLMHQGAVLGGLLAESLSAGVYPEHLEAGERKRILRRLTDDPLTLPAAVPGGKARVQALREAVSAFHALSRTHWVDVPFTYEETEASESLRIITAEPDEILPLLRERLLRETRPYDWRGRKKEEGSLRIALIGFCLFHGWDGDVMEFRDFVMEELAGNELPERTASTMCAQLLPDHGVMPETVYRMNLLGWSDQECIIPVFRRVLELLIQTDRDYEDIRKGIYHYIESFAYAAEHSGRKEFVPMLLSLAAFPEFERTDQAKRQVELMTERLQILRLILYRALVRLGAPEGKKGLEELEKCPGLAIRLSARMALEHEAGSADGHEPGGPPLEAPWPKAKTW